MEYRGVGRFPGNVPRFRYPRPGGPMPRPPRALLSMPPRARFEPPRPIRSRFYTPRGSIHMSFRGFKATPMVPRSQAQESENKPGKTSLTTNLKGANDDSTIPKQIDSHAETSKSSDMSNTGNSNGQSGNQGGEDLHHRDRASQDPHSDKTSNEGVNMKDMNKPVNQDAYFEETANQDSYSHSTANQDSYSHDTAYKDSYSHSTANKDSYSHDTANQDSYSHSTANKDSYSHSTANQDSYSHDTANKDSYSHSTANRDSYSKQIPHQESNQDSYPCNQENTGPDHGNKKTEGGGDKEEADSDDENTGFCQFCSMSFASDEAYGKHTRGLLHTQKVMEAETVKEDRVPEIKDLAVPDTAGSAKMENKASEKDLQYIKQTGFNTQGNRGRGGYHSPTKDFSRGQSEQGYSQGHNVRGTSGRGRGQGFNRYGKNFSDYNMTAIGQRSLQEQEGEGYSGYGENDEYQDYGGQECCENYEEGEDYGDYGGSGDYNNSQQEQNTDGPEEEEYSFNSSNWMDIDKTPEKIPVSERDLDPDTLGKPQFPNDFYCKACDVRCTSQKNFEMHVEGTKHKMKTILGKGESGDGKEDNKKKKMVVECSNRPSKVEHIIRKSDLPIVGLQYVTEFQKADSTARPSYVCNLCESKCDMNTVLSHATGFKHRLNYFREHHKDIYEHMALNSSKKKSEQNASAEEFAADCMKKDGQGKIRVKLEIDSATEAVAANLLSQSGIKMDTFISDLKTKPGPPLPEKKPRMTPVPNRQENFGPSYDRGYNKRPSDNQYDFSSKHPRGPGTSECYGDTVSHTDVFDYNHRGIQRKASQNSHQVETRHPVHPVQPSVQPSIQPSVTEKKTVEEANPPDAPGNTTTEMLFALSQTMINTEEDAAMALQVSNALTQALLQYRLKNVPKELTSGLSSSGGQTAVQTKSSDSKKLCAASTSTRSVSKSTPPPVQTMSLHGSAPSSTSYVQGVPSTMPVISEMMPSIPYTSTVPTGVPPVTDPLSQHMNPVNPEYPMSSTQYPGAISTTQYPGAISTAQYPGAISNTQYQGAISMTQYPGTISTTQYSGAISTTQYPGAISTSQYPEYTYYGGQYQPPVPEGYQWGFNTMTQGEPPPPPLPPSEDLPQPPPENQKY
ncbi:uncharacterized protein LOC125665584 isoform X2 [Ostrea edulis]|uniref:uncharacterized protein LOC125665584 isoform X2 n=1 Tax=Ostrea edulis TaxID=37623 RepID=UPI0024AFB553|nr:uncharacterized protein LOC125665584 isoform X2 [Ostrea edulis]